MAEGLVLLIGVIVILLVVAGLCRLFPTAAQWVESRIGRRSSWPEYEQRSNRW